MWELTDLRKSASVLKESDGWLKMSGDRRFLDDIDCDPEARDVLNGNGKFVVSSSVGNTKCSNIYLSDVINIPYVSKTYVKVKDTE